MSGGGAPGGTVLLPAEEASALDPSALAVLDDAGVQVVEAVPRGASVLVLTRDVHGRWGLHDPSVKRGPSLRPDFERGEIARRARTTFHAHEPLRTALGKGPARRVLDMTCGLGRDAWMLAVWGHAVTTCERQPLLAWLVGDAMAAAPAPEAGRPTLIGADARSVDGAFDVVYLDPMFPPSRKSALPSGEVQLLRRIAGEDDAGDALLAHALAHATERVVVKRPRHAPPLAAERPPSARLEGQATRFDLYAVGGR